MVHHLLNYIHSLVKSVFFLKKKTEKNFIFIGSQKPSHKL
jgi:hypothetical protein